MITELVHSWELFHNTYLAGWCIGLFLSLVGILAVARDQIFLTAASPRRRPLAWHWACGWAAWLPTGQRYTRTAFCLDGRWYSPCSLCCSQSGGDRPAAKASRLSPAGSFSCRQAARCCSRIVRMGLKSPPAAFFKPHRGERHRDGIFAGLTALTSVVLLRFHRPIVLVTLDPLLAQAMGLKTQRWMGASVAIALDLATGLSIRSAGLLYTFGCLVLPALVAKNLCCEIRTMFIMAPCIVLGSGLVGFILANHYDLPPAQMTVALFCVFLLMACALRARIRRYTAR